MPVYLRDNVQITPRLRDGAPNTGNLDAMVMTGNAGYFTEPIEVGTYIELLALLYTTAHGGSTPTLDVNMQYGWKDINNQFHWVDSGDSFTQITTTGDGLTALKQMTANFGKWIRFRLKIGGTANPTYTVTLKLMCKG